jgi:hypothetical protein
MDQRRPGDRPRVNTLGEGRINQLSGDNRRMSHPQHQLRAVLDDGPHSGQTISIDCDEDGQAPKRIVVEIPSEGLQPHERPADGQDSEGPVSGSAITYELHDSDDDLGLWVYRMAPDR